MVLFYSRRIPLSFLLSAGENSPVLLSFSVRSTAARDSRGDADGNVTHSVGEWVCSISVPHVFDFAESAPISPTYGDLLSPQIRAHCQLGRHRSMKCVGLEGPIGKIPAKTTGDYRGGASLD